MVHLRLNEREPNPNKHINFISALPTRGMPAPFSEEDARQLLRALAAQVRPIMKSHGFAVNSFEEYEYNRVFAGRNWNNGETIELVLRHADGTFVSIPFLLGTLCHELAHIKHMNHGRDFQKLWSQLRMEVRALQERGYFGDGYWSSGTRISGSLRVGGEGVEEYDLPEYLCGGAQTRSRPPSFTRRRRRANRPAGPSPHTGAQAKKKRKPGSRVKTKGAFKGEGRALNEDVSDEDAKNKGIGFRKRAGSKRAREERALAAEKRLKALKGILPKESNRAVDEDSLTESDPEYDDFDSQPERAETDETRRQALKNAAKEGDEGQALMSSQRFMRDFLLSSSNSHSSGPSSSGRAVTNTSDTGHGDHSKVLDAIEVSDTDNEEDEEDGEGTKGGKYSIPSVSHPDNPRPRSRSLSGSSDNDNTRRTKRARLHSNSPPLESRGPPNLMPPSSKTGPSRSARERGLGGLLQEEISTRRREALGLPEEIARGLASGPGPSSQSQSSHINSDGIRDDQGVGERGGADYGHGADRQGTWTCLVCTLQNQPAHLACSACATPRGEKSWPHR